MQRIHLFIAVLLILPGCNSYKVFTSKDFEEKHVWIYHISGIQCQITYFPDILAAKEFLFSKGISVISSKEIHLITRTACGYPSGLNFAVKIKETDFQQALELGWQVVDKEMLEKFGLY